MSGTVLSAIAVYAGGLVIGLTLVSFPASSSFLVYAHELTPQQYGSIFIPQLILAIAGALLAGACVRIMRLRSMYLIAVLCFAFSSFTLAASLTVESDKALSCIMLSTALFGFGFGFGGGPLNGIAGMLSKTHGNASLVGLHVAAGAGLTIGPLYFSYFLGRDSWIYAPAILCCAALMLFLLGMIADMPEPAIGDTRSSTRSAARSGHFWLIMVIAVLYALSEGTFSNWAVIYVEEKGLSSMAAAASLSAFWACLTIGRLAVTVALLWIKPIFIWLLLPVLMILAFYLLPIADSEQSTIISFAFAGFACSAFFPLMVAVAAEPYPPATSWIASMLTAALMFGVGLGSYAIGSFKTQVSLDNLYLLSTTYPALALVLIIISRKVSRNPVTRGDLDV